MAIMQMAVKCLNCGANINYKANGLNSGLREVKIWMTSKYWMNLRATY